MREWDREIGLKPVGSHQFGVKWLSEKSARVQRADRPLLLALPLRVHGQSRAQAAFTRDTPQLVGESIRALAVLLSTSRPAKLQRVAEREYRSASAQAQLFLERALASNERQ